MNDYNRGFVGRSDTPTGLDFRAPLDVGVVIEADVRPDAANVFTHMEVVGEHVANGIDNSWLHRRNAALSAQQSAAVEAEVVEAIVADVATVDPRKCGFGDGCGAWKQKGYDTCHAHRGDR